MAEPIKKQVSDIITRFLYMLTIVWSYFRTIIIILAPMFFLYPFALLSWKVVFFFNTENWGWSWIVLQGTEYTPGVIVLIVFEFLLFLIGLVLIVYGIVSLANSILKKESLVKKGSYRLIRHPQHLGLILISLSLSLFVPWSTDLGIRFGDILSWSVFSIILFFWSDYEEWKLIKKLGDDYVEYRLNTGMFFPKLFSTHRKVEDYKKIRYWVRYPLVIIGYICFLALLYLVTFLLIQAGMVTFFG
jgi:protein-S-isoprenylcysteine O-methyltransferase Ste14